MKKDFIGQGHEIETTSGKIGVVLSVLSEKYYVKFNDGTQGMVHRENVKNNCLH